MTRRAGYLARLVIVRLCCHGDWCRSCGSEGVPGGCSPVQLHEPFDPGPTTLLMRRYRCTHWAESKRRMFDLPVRLPAVS